jgi:hypothetical protein
MFEPIRDAIFGQRRQGPVGRNMVLLAGALAMALGAALAAPASTGSLLRAQIAGLDLVPFTSPLVAPVDTTLRMPVFRHYAPAPDAIGIEVERDQSIR